MGKKESTQSPALAAEVMAALRPELKALVAKLSVEEVAELSTMSTEDVVASLELAMSLEASAVSTTDVAFVDAKPVQANITILTPGSIGLRAGTRFSAYLLGTTHIFSKESKENWKEYKTEKHLYFYNSYYKFRDINGKEFGIWASPTLRILEKIGTHTATPSLVAADPMVEITYVGKIEGKERLKQEFDIELQKGNACHVFKVRVAAGIKVNSYVKGCLNSLNSPFPIENNSDVTMSREEADRLNYEKLMALQSGDSGIAGIIAQ